MIKNKQDLYEYMRLDSQANIRRVKCSWLWMKVNLFYGNDSYRFLNYMKALRRYEYVLNCKKGYISSIIKLFAKLRWHRLGAKYNVNINPNIAGPGLRCPHLVGGGDFKL